MSEDTRQALLALAAIFGGAVFIGGLALLVDWVSPPRVTNVYVHLDAPLIAAPKTGG